MLTSDILMATFEEPEHICVWQLNIQEMAYFSVGIGCFPPTVICTPITSHLFIIWHDAIKIWEVSMTSSHMISETQTPNTSKIKSICPSHNSNRILVESKSGIVRMWDMNLVRNQTVTMNTQDNTDMQKLIIAVSYSRKMVATKSTQSVELWNITTWEVIRYMDYKSHVEISFSPDKN